MREHAPYAVLTAGKDFKMESIIFILCWLLLGLLCSYRIYRISKKAGTEFSAAGYVVLVICALCGFITFMALALYYMVGGDDEK